MPRMAAMQKITGLAPVRENDGRFTACNGVVMTTDAGHTYGKCIPPGDYAVLDSGDLDLVLSNMTVCGQDWLVWLSGQRAVLAVNRNLGITIRSMHRLGKPEEMREQPHNTPEERAEGAHFIGERWLECQEELGIRPGSGLTSSVKQLAPLLDKERRHGGHTLLYQQQAFRGGRNELFRYQASERVVQYDLRSAYAGAYGNGVPGAFVGRSKTFPKHDFWAAALTVSVPRSESVPVAPYRTPGGMLTFPTGTFDGWFSAPEVRLLEKAGHIAKVKEVHVFAEWHPLDRFAHDLYTARQKSACKVKQSLCKLLLVSAYGSFCVSGSFPLWHVWPSNIPDGADIISPGTYQTIDTPRHSLAHFPAAAFITSKIRARLADVLSDSRRDPYYCAIDSVVLSKSEPPLTVGPNPGDWDIKGEFDPPSFWRAPGTYSLGGGAIRRSSGVPASSAAKYLDGEIVTFQKTMGSKETLRNRGSRQVSVRVRLKHDTGQKRPPCGDGRSRAITIEEAILL